MTTDGPTCPLGAPAPTDTSSATRVTTRRLRAVDDERLQRLASAQRRRSLLSQLPAEDGGAAAPAGQDDDRFRVVDEVGRGGMGRVLRVLDADLNREVAMKVLLREGGSGESLRRFVEEAQITGQLEHPGVLPVHDLGLDAEGNLFFTMQLLRTHDTLAHVIDRLREDDPQYHARYTFERRVQVIQRVCHVLEHAHQRGVLHRDIKPSNIMVGEYGEVYLVDWGVAKLLDAQRGDGGPADARPAAPRLAFEPERIDPALVDPKAETSAVSPFDPHAPTQGDDDTLADGTQEGAVLGTPAYMAPEQLMGLSDQLGPATDVYALCTVLYELLTLNYYLGHLDGSLTGLMRAVVEDAPLDAEAHVDPVRGRVPRSLSRVCRKGLAKAPAERYASARELEQALQAWLEGNAPVVCPGTGLQRSLSRTSRWIDRHPVLGPALIITTLVLLLGWASVATVLALRAG